MSKSTKIWLIIATSLILIGCIILVGTMSVLKWDFKKLSTVKFETNSYDITEEYSDISINTNTADIVFVPSKIQETKVVCYEQKNVKHSVTVQNNSLVIKVVDLRKWYEHIGISFDNSKITVYIPQGEYGALSVKGSTGDIEIPKNFSFKSIDISQNTGDVSCLASALEKIKIKTSTGDINVKNISCNMLDLSTSTGGVSAHSVNCTGDIKINLSTGKSDISDVKCQNITSSASTGDTTLKNVIAKEKLTLARSTGHVKFEKCDAAEILIETDTGNVSGSLLSDKVFITQSDTGSINVPKTVAGGKCEITTDTGNIKVKID